MKSRLKVMVLAFALLLSTLVMADVSMVNTYADGERTIRFHYTRSDGAYDDWTMWVWNENENGKGYEFEIAADNSEAVSTYTCDMSATQIGFIVKGKADWSKDVAENRFVDLTSVTASVVDVYIQSEVQEFTTEVQDGNADNSAAVETTAASQDDTVASQESTASSQNEAQEEESDDPNADYSASTATVIIVDLVVLLVVAALCFTILGKKKDMIN